MPTLSIEPNPRVTFRIVHQDEHLLIADKRSGLVTQPGVAHHHDTLLNGLFASFGPALQNLGEKRDFGLIHRLDKETSGLLVVALTTSAHERLDQMIRARRIAKFYWAVVRQPPGEPTGVIRLAIAEQVRNVNRYAQERIAVIVRGATADAKPALTAYRLLDASPHAALLEARPITGRLHQIRVHLDAIGCTVLGDPRYGPKHARALSPRLALHAHRLRFDHPITGQPVDAQSPMPSELRRVLRQLKLAIPVSTPADVDQHAEELARDEIGETES